MMKSLKVLLLEDSTYDAEIIQRLLLKRHSSWICKLVGNRQEYIEALDIFIPDIILSDNALPQFSAAEALKVARQHSPDIPFILVTGTVSEEFAVDIIKQGADDYILKDRLSRLPNAIGFTLKQRQIEKERLEALRELKESNERYRIVAKATSDTIWDWDLVTGKVSWSKNLQEIFGYVELVTDTGWWYGNIHPEDKNSVRKEVAAQIDGKVLRFENQYRFRCANGSYKYVNDRSFLVIDDSGDPVRMIGAMQDITRQKEEEFRLKLLESVITNATDAVVIMEAGPIKKGGQKIVYVNDAFTKMTGYTKEEVVGRTSAFMQDSNTNKEALQKLEKSIEKGEACEVEIIKYHKNGEELWVQKAVAPVEDSKGKITYYIAIERDITERKVMDQKITKAIISAQDEERFQIGGELHDNVTQILAGTLISLGMLRKNPNIAGATQFMNQCHDYILLAIDEIRQLSHKLAPVFFKEETLVHTFERLLTTMNADQKFTVVLNAGALEGITLSNDMQINLYRMLQEQLNNIVKYAAAKVVNITVSIEGDNLRMVIHDDGKGFDTRVMRKGIGLGNIQKRAELFQGSFFIESAPGRGCTLTVEIPVKNVRAENESYA